MICSSRVAFPAPSGLVSASPYGFLCVKEVGLDHREILRMPVGEFLGFDEQCPHIDIVNRLERLQFHRIVLSFILTVCFFCYVLTGAVIIYIKKDAFSLSLARVEL